MKVLILTAVPFPNGMAATNRIKCYAKALAEQGVDCKVLCFRRSDIKTNTTKEGREDGVEFKYVGRNSIRSKGWKGRLEDLIDHLHLLLSLLLTVNKNTVVFSYGSTLHFGNMLIMVTHLKGGTFVRDLVEIPNVVLNDTPKQKRIREKELKCQFPRYDGVIAISTALKEMAEVYINKPNAVLQVPILVDYEKYYLEDQSEVAEKSFIFHSGTLTDQKDGITGMIEAFGKAVNSIDTPIYFYSTGYIEKSPQREEIKGIIEKYGIEDNVRFLGYLSDKELQEYMKKASLVIINKYKTEQNIYCFSTKLGEYMAAGIPVIITNVGEAMNWLIDGADARIVETENNDALATAIIELIDNKGLRKRIGERGRETCKRSFDYHNYGKPIRDFFQSLMK